MWSVYGCSYGDWLYILTFTGWYLMIESTITLFRVRATYLFKSYDGDMSCGVREKYFLNEQEAIAYGIRVSKGSKGCTYSVTSFEV